MKISILKSHLVFEISCRFKNKTAGNFKYIVKSFYNINEGHRNIHIPPGLPNHR